MIPSLYKPFRHWSKNGSVYIISDTHFNDPDCKIMNPNWPSPEEQVKRIRETVHKNDTLIHLGDVGDTKYIAQLNCYKVLITGNHDKGADSYIKKEEMFDLDSCSEEEVAQMLLDGTIDRTGYEYHSPFNRGFKSNNLFNEVYSGPLWIAEKIILSHEPLSITLRGTDFARPVVMNLHGHTHGVAFDEHPGFRNFCSDVIDYEPISLGILIKNGLLKDITSAHRATIDMASIVKEIIYE